MQAQISLLIDQQPGSLFRVVAALRRFGLVFEDDALSARQVSEGYNVSLCVDGATVPTVELRDQIRNLRGVTRVRDVRRLVPPLPGPDVFMPDDVSDRRTLREDPAREEDERTRRREAASRIEAVIQSYPAISTPVIGYIDSVETVADRDELVRNFGLRCGRRLAAVEGRFGDAQGLEEALEKVMRGFLFPIARVEIDDLSISLQESVFTDPERSDAVRVGSAKGLSTCAFLTGLIDGMLNHARGLPDLKVTESRCRHRGDSRCEFTIDPMRGPS